MSISEVVGIVLEVLVAGIVGVLLDRALGNAALVVWLAVCLVGLGWLHWGEIRPIFATKRLAQQEPLLETQQSTPKPLPQSLPSEAPKAKSATPSALSPNKAGRQSLLPSKESLEVVSFDSTQGISIANNESVSVYIISLVISLQTLNVSRSFNLGSDINAGDVHKYPLARPFPSFKTTEKLADTWEEHVKKAADLYKGCGTAFSFFSPSDPGFQQIKTYYSHDGKEFPYDDHVSAVLSYRLKGTVEIREQPIQVVVTTLVSSTCP